MRSDQLGPAVMAGLGAMCPEIAYHAHAPFSTVCRHQCCTPLPMPIVQILFEEAPDAVAEVPVAAAAPASPPSAPHMCCGSIAQPKHLSKPALQSPVFKTLVPDWKKMKRPPSFHKLPHWDIPRSCRHAEPQGLPEL